MWSRGSRCDRSNFVSHTEVIDEGRGTSKIHYCNKSRDPIETAARLALRRVLAVSG